MLLKKLLLARFARTGGVLCLLAALSTSVAVEPARAESLQTLPSFQQCVKRALEVGSTGAEDALTRSEIEYQVKQAYDRILVRKEQIAISREVQGHFEKAVTAAEQKFEEGEGDVTQGALTKLKLGLAGTLNDINQFESDIALARLDLEGLLGVGIDPQFKMDDETLSPREFPFQTLKEYLKQAEDASRSALKGERRIALEKSMVRVNQARSQFILAGKNRKMTRALLVTEVANYDFGIGSEKDLFETLIIYTRVLVGYYDALFHFNEAVAKFEREFLSK